jgi:hypothetical protein
MRWSFETHTGNSFLIGTGSTFEALHLEHNGLHLGLNPAMQQKPEPDLKTLFPDLSEQ